ncbi:MAG: CDP-diacylglycerol--glycerol-3-phosphate 3-phosphatidyltransferase [Firmicutes bacterium]|nr:CDP-diacylglycerol--glycerol-3-phosphate 3-phosphatidyltransferase [Bacillota bacterium]
MSLANKLTVVRIILVPVFMIFLLVKIIPFGELWAALIFVLAAVTDGLDGYYARKMKKVTRFGKFLDTLADKLLISAALISLVALNALNPWVAFIIVSREFAVTGLRLLAAAEGIIIAANPWGKLKTIAQICMVLAIIIEMFIYTAAGKTLWLKTLLTYYPAAEISLVALWSAVILTIISGIYYFYHYKKVIY